MAKIIDPFILFKEWFNRACETELNDPNAMALATATPTGIPSVRMVLLKGLENNQFIFFTNFESRKGQEIKQNNYVSLCFYWKSLHQQIRIGGIAQPVTDESADAYFKTRARGSQIGAWASQQSQPLTSIQELKEATAHYKHYYEGKEIPRPPHWSGFAVSPSTMEFWEEQPFRLHRRLLYTRQEEEWVQSFLYP